MTISDSHQEKGNVPFLLFILTCLWRTIYFGSYVAKVGKTPSVSDQSSVYTCFPEGGVVWNLPYWASGQTKKTSVSGPVSGRN